MRERGRRGRDTFFPRLGRSPAPAAAPWLPRGRSRLSRAGRRAAGGPHTPPSALRPFPPARPGARSVLHRQGAGAASRRRGPIGRGGDAGEEARRRVGFLLATRGGEGKPEQLGRKRSASGKRRRLPSASGSTDRREAEGGRAWRRGGREAGETVGEADGAAAEGGEDGGRLGGTGHPPSPSSSAHRATAGRGRPRGAPGSSWRVPPRGGRGQDGGPQSAAGRGPSRRLRAVISYQVSPPRAFAEGGATPAPGAPTGRWRLARGLHAGAPARECGLSAPKRRGWG